MQELYNEVTKQFQKRHHIAHDIKHALRVAQLAKYIAQAEGYDVREAEIAGLLHDMGRTVQEEEKNHGPAGVPLSRELLNKYTDYDNATKERILSAIEHHSELHTTGVLTHIVQDADMLDGMGAVGLMRAYMSKADLPDYDPENMVPTKGQRGTNVHDQIAFQMEWLEFMHTPTGKRLAQKRYDVMLNFLKTLQAEVTLKDAEDAI